MRFSKLKGRGEAVAQVQICRGFGDRDWEELSKRLERGDAIQPNERDWQRAVSIFERRMRERFFLCIEELEKARTQDYVTIPDEPNPDRHLPEESLTTGFAIMALCCLLIDTLQFFRAGAPTWTPPEKCPRPEKCANPSPGTGKAFVRFLTECLSFEEKDAKEFYNGIRNGILHQAETRGWVIRRDKPENRVVACEVEPCILNRTLFCNALGTWFKCYVKQLRDPKEIDLRRHFAAGMKHVVDRC